MKHRRRFSAFVAKDCNAASTIRQALQFARDFLEASDFEPQLKVKLAIIVEELVTNALHHGGKYQDLSLALELSLELSPELSLELTGQGTAIRLSMDDNGPAFNPLAVPPVKRPDPATGGGIGLAIVQAWAKDSGYRRDAGINSLSLTLAS